MSVIMLTYFLAYLLNNFVNKDGTGFQGPNYCYARTKQIMLLMRRNSIHN